MSTAARVRQEPRRLELVAREIAGLPGVETHAYRAGEVLLPTERLKQLDVYVRDGAIGLRLAVGRANHAMLDVFGPGSLVTPQVWESESSTETRHAIALPAPGASRDPPADAVEGLLTATLPSARGGGAGPPRRYAALVDRLAMLSL